MGTKIWEKASLSRDMIQCFPNQLFHAKDIICVPAGWEAVLESNGAFLQTFREGKNSLSEMGCKKCRGNLYFMRIVPSEDLKWGKGGLFIGRKRCGIHGVCRLEVVSGRKFLHSFIAENMPITVDHVYDRILDLVIGSVEDMFRSMDVLHIEKQEGKRLLEAFVLQSLEEPIEKLGLKLVFFTVEDIICEQEY